MYLPTCGTRLNTKVVPAKWVQCSNTNGQNQNSSKLIYSPTKHTDSCYENMLFTSLGAPRWHFHNCRNMCFRQKKICIQKQFLPEHHQNTAKPSYRNTTGTRNGYKNDKADKG